MKPDRAAREGRKVRKVRLDNRSTFSPFWNLFGEEDTVQREKRKKIHLVKHNVWYNIGIFICIILNSIKILKLLIKILNILNHCDVIDKTSAWPTRHDCSLCHRLLIIGWNNLLIVRNETVERFESFNNFIDKSASVLNIKWWRLNALIADTRSFNAKDNPDYLRD